MESGFAIDVNLRSKRSAEHRPACACGYGSNGEGLYHMAGQGGTALESQQKQWSSSFPDRLATRDCQTAGVEFQEAGKDSWWVGGVSCQSWLPPTRGRWRAGLRLMSTYVRRGRLNTDPPAPVATGQTVKACTIWQGRVALLWSLRKSSGLRFFRIVWRHEIVKQRASSLRWRGKIRVTGCPQADNPTHESLRKNLWWVGGVSCQSWLPPTRGRWRAGLRSMN